MKINTVNVIEQTGYQINLAAFPETSKGNQSAEAHFKKLAKENGCQDDLLDEVVENGIFIYQGYTLFLVHSS